MEEEILEKQEIIYVEEDIVDIEITEGEPSTTISEEVKTIDVEAPQEVEVGVGEGFGSITSGNGERSHPLLYGRDLRDQHPISAITGLEEKLESIESLKTVYSDKQGFANYYKWHKDAYDEYGYFVSLVPNTITIKICEGADIFGVTVDAAGFVGGQDEVVPRDNKYALVATTGLVNVRCELDVEVGSYVVSNRSGVAEPTDSGCGYKVVATPKINGEVYATISLGVQACTTDLMGQKIQRLDDRLDEDEKDIGAAMQVANEAFQKAGESANISEEALKDALEALKKTEEMDGVIDDFYENLESTNQIAVQAKAIAEGAITEAGRIQGEAYDVANDALTNVNDLVKKFEPLNEWVDPATGQVGAEYVINYMDNQGLATKIEIQTVESLAEDNKSAIEQNAQNITMMVSSVDKYSVGEFSQAYGLTREQAKSILKPGYIYIPTDNFNKCCDVHVNIGTHCETFLDDGEVNYFTPGDYYVWGINDQGKADWIEHGVGKVWISSEEPTGAGYTYWYNNSSLFVLQDGEWIEVATLAGNVNNRITSMIRQDVDEVRAEVVNAYGGVAGFGAKLSDTDAKVNSIASWPTGGGTHNMAVLESKGDGDNAHMVLAAVTNVGGNPTVTELGGAKIVLNDSENGSYIQMDADKIDFTTGDFQIDASHIINLEAPEIDLKGYVTFADLETDGSTTISGSNIKTGTIDASIVNVENISADNITSGTIDAELVLAGEVTAKNINATGGTIGGCSIVDGVLQIDELIAAFVDADYVSGLECNFKKGSVGGWKLDSNSLYSGSSFGSGSFLCTGSTGTSGTFTIGGSDKINGWVFKAGDNFGVTKDGVIYGTKGVIGGWVVGENMLSCDAPSDEAWGVGSIGMYSGNADIYKVMSPINSELTPIRFYAGSAIVNAAPFKVLADGSLIVSALVADGTINAIGGTIGGWNIGKDVEIPVSATNKITADALYSGTITEGTRSYKVYLTAMGVYISGQERTGASYFNNKSWYQLLLN